MSEARIRPYREADREAVRRICFDTGFMGESVSWQYGDLDSFADMFATWYVDHEPESAWVVDEDGAATGYLLGCSDSSRAADPAAVLARHALRRGLLLRRGTAGFVWRGALDVARNLADLRVPVDLDEFPAHLHIDLLPRARGRGFGRRLVQGWLDRLAEAGIGGVHLGTMAENTGAVAFFATMGFEPVGAPLPAPGFRTRAGRPMRAQFMARSVGR